MSHPVDKTRQQKTKKLHSSTPSALPQKQQRLALKLKENMVKRKIQKKNRSECDKVL